MRYEISLSLIAMTFVAALIEILNTRLLVKLAASAWERSQYDGMSFIHNCEASDIPSGDDATLANDSDGFELDSMVMPKLPITP